jgi:hypothetical protein
MAAGRADATSVLARWSGHYLTMSSSPAGGEDACIIAAATPAPGSVNTVIAYGYPIRSPITVARASPGARSAAPGPRFVTVTPERRGNLLGDGGLLEQMTKEVLQWSLDADLT